MSTENFERMERMERMDSPGALMKSMSVLSLGTLASRILGFVRDIILAQFFGTGFRADAFFVAFRIPNLFRDLVGEGAANSAVVPVLAEYLHRDKRESFWRFVSVVLVLAMMILSLITLAGMVLAPGIVRLLAPGFMADALKLEMAVRLTRMVFPYLIFIGLTAYSMAILYSFRAFAVPAFSPCLLNIAVIISAVLSVRYLAEPVYGLALGVLVGGLCQFAVQIPPLVKIGYRFQRPATLRHPGIVRVGSLLAPRMVGAGVYQLTIFVDTFCASLASVVGAGGISAIYYANRIIQLPMGVFSVALASAVLPTLASLAARKQTGAFRETLVFSIQNIVFILAPVSVITMVLARPIIRILFERGAFDAYSTAVTSSALAFYAIGLAAFGGIKVMAAAFYSLQDTRTPVKVASIALVINAGLNGALMWPMKMAGIALASSIGAWFNFAVLVWLMNRRVGGLSHDLGRFIICVTASSGLAGVAAVLAWSRFFAGAHDFLRLGCAMALGTAVYAGAAYGLGVRPARHAAAWIRRRLGGASPAKGARGGGQ